MTVNRFFYVRAPHGRVMHIQRTRYHTAGRTDCGLISATGWHWQNRGSTPRCKRCERAK